MPAMERERRAALGQFYTPAHVADLALALALPPARTAAHITVLDPACGDGAFLARARALGIPAAHLCGVEIDAAAAAAARSHAPGAAIWHGDLFDLELGTLGAPFDAVVGNPPYVRQERLSAQQKQRIADCLARDIPDLTLEAARRLMGRGDLACACIIRALSAAKPGARLSLVVSSALLDAAYGQALWQALARIGRVVMLAHAPDEHWFADAAVKTMILVVERHGPEQPGVPQNQAVRVARLTVPTAQAAQRLLAGDDIAAVADIRHAPADRPQRWSAYLRAEAAWFALETRAAGGLVRLGEVAEVRRGVTSGANDIFYLRREQARALGIEPELLMPLLRTPRDGGHIALDPDASSHLALVCPADPAELARYPAAGRYLAAHQHCAERPTLRVRQPWWALAVRPARLFLTKAYGARFVQRLAERPMVADQRVYAIYPHIPDSGGTMATPMTTIDVEVLAAVLNSTFTACALEALGRSSMGEGALEWSVADAADLPIIDPRRLCGQKAEDVRQALRAMWKRPIGPVDSERDRPDRHALDCAVAAAIPGLEDLLGALWPALLAAVARRNRRPRQARDVVASAARNVPLSGQRRQGVLASRRA